MSLLRDNAWRLKYTPEDGNLVRLFYLPALRSATRYDRLTGYFTAPALALAARGIEGLIVNGGKLRLCVGCTLDEAEANAIDQGSSIRAALEEHLLRSPLATEDARTIDALELLAWMIAHGHMEVKVSIPCDDNRKPIASDVIFHEKSGVIEDKTGDRIAFTGSINETLQGWTRNWESFSVFTSWNDLARVDVEEESFAKVWADKAKRTRTLDVSDAVRENLLRFLPDPDKLPARLEGFVGSSPPASSPRASMEDESCPPSSTEPLSADEERAAIWDRIAAAARDPNGGDRVGEATSTVIPWPHQIRAYQRLYGQWPPKLLIADEVGLGKTIQAGLLLRQAWMAGRARRILVLAPKSVCRQWQIEMREKFNLDWPIYDGQRLCLQKTPARPNGLERDVSRNDWHKEPFVIMSSHLARRRDRRAELVDVAQPWDLIVVDEAHHARRKGAGTQQDGGPNTLLRLLGQLKSRTEGLVLLTATPMQVHPVELWDLLSLLGLPPEWTPEAFERFFREAAHDHLPNDRLEWLARLFRANEAHYGQVERNDAQKWTKLSSLRARRVLEALRDKSAIPRRNLGTEDRTAAAAIIRRSTPVKALVSRHTRELLRAYHRAGKLSTPVATRKVEDRFIPLSEDETRLYRRVEDYISTIYNRASADERNAVGFVMTIYRRRLASSFLALRKTLEGRSQRLAGQVPSNDLLRLEEDIADQVEAGEEFDVDEASTEASEALVLEESEEIRNIVAEIGRLPVDTKTMRLVAELEDLRGAGYHQAIVFTQFTDTMDFLRDHIASASDRSVICFSGRGGEVRAPDGRWTVISREDVKRRFREGRAEILICTDAAAEGLNFQFCGALINYDMPWNPMRVEQRIGRIDRLGQRFADIRIVNLHYSDTVEADVYRALRERIDLFTSVVGGLQPILAALPRVIESSVLSLRGEAARDEAVRSVENSISTAGANPLDLDAFADEDLDIPTRPEPALTLADLKAILDRPILLPRGTEAAPLDQSDYRYVDGDLAQALRVTVDPQFFEVHSESVEFWTPGSPAFPKLESTVS